MRIALTYNLRLTEAVEEAEFDKPETIAAVVRPLVAAGHTVERIEVTGPASRLVARLEAFAPDIVFNLAEGRRGKMRRGFYPALFEELGIPATGSDAYALCVTLDKSLTKKLLAGYGVPSARGRFVTKASLRGGGFDELPFPVIAKPNFEGSSKGIEQQNVAEDPIELGQVLDELLAVYPDGVLIERYIPGVDVRVCKVDGAPRLPLVELAVDPEYPHRFDILDYTLKHDHAAQLKPYIPPRIPAKVAERIVELGDRCFDALGLRDAATLDFRVGLGGEVYFLSATALPSFEPDASFFAATRSAGLSYDQTVLAIVRAAAARAGLLPLVDSTKPR